MPTCSTWVRSLLIGTVLLICTGLHLARTEDDPVVEKLPFCGNAAPEDGSDLGDRLVYVTTLDGRLTALDIMDGGEKRWSIETGPGPLLSSSIHRLELTNHGKWVRMIPSLSGGLYKFDGDSLESIPFSADDLLKSSFKFSDDLVISGGKETRSYGVSVRTGQLVYECTMHGCRNATEIERERQSKYGPPVDDQDATRAMLDTHDPQLDDMIVVRRQTQTVRAVEPRTGSERWNFSIGHHEVEKMTNVDCQGGTKRDLDPVLLDLELRVIIPEGMICAFSKSSPGTIVWKQKFDFPIVSAWRSKNRNDLMSVNLFDRTDWLWNGNAGQSQNADDQRHNGLLVNPALYIGMHQKQLYIQESVELIAKGQYGNDDATQNMLLIDDQYPSIPWKPVSAVPNVAGLITDASGDVVPLVEDDQGESTAVAKSVLYSSNYINGNGYFLYGAEDNQQSCAQNGEGDMNSSTIQENDDGSSGENGKVRRPTSGDDADSMFDFNLDSDAPVKVIIVSIWFWWKEILVISATTALVVNVVIKARNDKQVVVVVERQIPIPMAVEAVEEEFPPAIRMAPRSFSESHSTNGTNGNASENFVSRFQTEFDLLQCLGKGGFGVVFEAKNKLDDCQYAIKRVVLPNKQESRDRVMREVRTLAHCEHQNIVRYFHTWIETPPPGWQESQDKIWMEKNCLSTSIDIETPTESLPPKVPLSAKVKEPMTNGLHGNIPNVWLPKFSDMSFSNGKKLDQSNDSSFIEFRADHSTRSRSSSLTMSQMKRSHDSSGNDHDSEDSFSIEFKHSADHGDSLDIVFKEEPSATGTGDPSTDHHVVAIDVPKAINETSEAPHIVAFRRRHRRPLSLDLTSTGRVVPRTAATCSIPSTTETNSKATLPNPSNKIYLYIQMQLCRKQSLKEWLSLNDLGSRKEKVVPIFEQIVAGVEYVHLKGLIHRDLKPSNIFFSLDGRIKIGDFGLVTDSNEFLECDCDPSAAVVGIGNGRERHTKQVGTQLYMSPEQLKGLPYDYKVDIYSLGLILFELLVCFGTEMERICTLKSVRKCHFPDTFAEMHGNEHNLLTMMLSEVPNRRPTTLGIRAQPPFRRSQSNRSTTSLEGTMDNPFAANGGNGSDGPTTALDLDSDEWHFELPPRRNRSYSTTNSSASNGTGSGLQSSIV